ncbi:hypothetical protein BJV74DRAFT_820806 [Russula compacta]|nr:hypothetical protein BJV74DRAFT_820806 [Russula compacta]
MSAQTPSGSSTSSTSVTDSDATVHLHERDAQVSMLSDMFTRLECGASQSLSSIRSPSARAAALSAADKDIDEAVRLTRTLIIRRNDLLLLEIFHIYALEEPPWSSTQPLGWIRVTHVCHHWRQVALRDSSLWSRISGIPARPQWVSEALARARGAWLVINPVGMPSPKVLSMFPSHISHTRELRLRNLSMNHADAEAPVLEHFELCIEGRSPATIQELVGTAFFKGLAPRLRTFTLSQLCILELTITRFGEISTDDSPSIGNFDELIDLLVNCPALEILIFEYCLPPVPTEYSHGQTPQKTIHLPSLSRLCISESTPRLTSFLKMLKLPSSTKLHLRCTSETIFTNDECPLLPLVSAQFHNPAPVEFKSFRITADSLDYQIAVVASTSIPTSTTYPSDVFTGDMVIDAELALSFEELFGSDHCQNILGRICSMLPLSNLKFLSVFVPFEDESVNWVELSQRCKDLTRIHARGRGTCHLLRVLTPPRHPSTRSRGKGGKGKNRNNRDAPAQASNNDTPHVPVFPKLESLSLENLDFDKSVPNAGVVYDMFATVLQRRKAYNVPLKRLSIDQCCISTNRANALKKLVREFHWDGDEGVSPKNHYEDDESDEYDDGDGFDRYDGDGSDDVEGSRWEDYFVGSTQAEWEWWENYSDGW